MTRLEDTLRDALADAPTPPLAVTDPVAAVDRRLTRARLRLAAGAAAAAVVVTAGVVVPLQVLGDGHGPAQVAVAPTPAPDLRAVAAGGGSEWAVTDSGAGPDRSDSLLLRLDPATGRREQAVPLQLHASAVAFGLGRVWAWGSTSATVVTVDPADGTSITHSWQGLGAVRDVAFADGAAWVTLPDRVVRLVVAPGSRRLDQAATIDLVGAGRIVVTDSGHVWVQADTSLVLVSPVQPGHDPGDRVHMAGPLLGPAGGDQVWTYDGSRLVALTPELLRAGESVAQGARIPVPAEPAQVVTAADGSWYARAGRDLFHVAGGQVTARLADAYATSLAADPSGGVLFTDAAGRLRRWAPTR